MLQLTKWVKFKKREYQVPTRCGITGIFIYCHWELKLVQLNWEAVWHYLLKADIKIKMCRHSSLTPR